MKRKEGPGKRLTYQEWADIQARYEAGDRVVDLAKQFKVAAPTISTKASRNGWQRRGEVQAEAIKEARDQIRLTLKDRYLELAEVENENDYKLYRQAKETIWMLFARLKEKVKTLDPEAATNRLSYEANTLTTALRTAIEGQREVLRLRDLNIYHGTPESEDDLKRLIDLMTPLPFDDSDDVPDAQLGSEEVASE